MKFISRFYNGLRFTGFFLVLQTMAPGLSTAGQANTDLNPAFQTPANDMRILEDKVASIQRTTEVAPRKRWLRKR